MITTVADAQSGFAPSQRIITSVAAEAAKLQQIAAAGPIGKRHTSFELYDLLAKCMVLALRCVSGPDNDALRQVVAAQPANGNRRYVERGSDSFTLVCRFVFANLKSKGAERSNSSRYAHCLRQAHQRGIAPAGLAAHLKDNGGINALFVCRPLAAAGVTTKCLNLVTSITVPKGQAFHLVLRREADNRYAVLEFDNCVTIRGKG